MQVKVNFLSRFPMSLLEMRLLEQWRWQIIGTALRAINDVTALCVQARLFPSTSV